MQKTLKVAVIGCGKIANVAHFPAYEKMDDIKIVAVCDIKPERAKRAAERMGLPESAAYTDYNQLLKIEGLDAVDICTPNYLHSEIAVAALDAGLNVFTEKPDAVSVSEAQRMKAAAERSGRLLMAMRNSRYNDYSRFLKQYIEEGKMGEIYTARCGWLRRRGIPGKGGWFTTKSQSGGGPLIDLGVHMIDLSIWLMGNPKPVAVSGCTYRKFAQDTSASDSVHSAFGETQQDGVFDVEDLAMGLIRFDNGACMQIEFSWASNIERERIFVELRGTRAGASNDTDDGRFKIFTEECGNTVDIVPNLPKNLPEPHAANLRHFADVLLYGAQPDFVPQQGINIIAILEAMYRSAEEGREITI